MKMLVNIIIILIAIVALGVGAFVYLGMKSRAGAPQGLVDGRLAACPSSPNCVLSEAGADDKHAVAPLPASAWEKIPGAVGDLGGTVTQINETYVSATFKSKVFGFVDDVEFRKGDEAVHVRSASRVGYSDRGVNRARVEALRAKLGA